MYISQMFNIFYYIVALVNYGHSESIQIKNPLPYFRRQVEDVSEEYNTVETSISDTIIDTNLVSFLASNAKQIFEDVIELNENYSHFTTTVDHTDIQSYKKVRRNDEGDGKITADDDMQYENVTVRILINRNLDDSISFQNDIEMKDKKNILLLQQQTNERKSMEKFDKYDDATAPSVSSLLLDTTKNTQNNYAMDDVRSCIFCNNVETEDCFDPKNKLIPSVVCQQKDDLCYSQHTPFGVVDRGCFNLNHNLSTYVCSCNLCNYISIAKMPYIFSSKRDWVDNVIELSRTRNLRKSVFKNMSCLRCESNTTTTNMNGDTLENANCLEGNVGSLPVQVCDENEVCAVRAVRNDRYIWRGCIPFPLYNYWWSLCDSDLCNYDSLISVYDFI